MYATTRAIDMMFLGLRERDEPTIHAVLALCNLLDKWMVILAHDVANHSSATDWHEETMTTLSQFMRSLQRRVDDLGAHKEKLARAAHPSRN